MVGVSRVSDIQLSADEEIVFESDGAVLTNLRLITNWAARKKSDKIPSEVLLRDVSGFQKIDGGQDSRLHVGLPALLVGVVLNLVSLLVPPQVAWMENVLFLFGALALIIGLYLTLTSILRVKPHTTILFLVPGSEDMPVYFPGKENPKADQFTRSFIRTKRGL